MLSKPMGMRVLFELTGRLLYMRAMCLQSRLLGTPVYCLVWPFGVFLTSICPLPWCLNLGSLSL